jgi:hypothetical protein
MPSLHDKAHDGVLCTLSTQTSATTSGFAQKLAAEQLQSRASGTVRQGRRHGPSITTQISPAESLSSSQAVEPLCSVISLASSSKVEKKAKVIRPRNGGVFHSVTDYV